MKKLFTIVISLCISFGMYAQDESPFVPFVQEINTPKSLRQQEKPEYSSLIEKEAKERQARTATLLERSEKGLPAGNQSDAIQKALGTRATAERLDSIISYLPDGSKYSGQFVTYNEDNTAITSQTNSMWNENTKSWEIEEEYTWGWDENLNCTFSQVYQPLWYNGERNEYTYDDMGWIATRTILIYDSGQWINMGKYTFKRDDRGNITELLYYYYDGGWSESDRELVEYDNYNRQTLWQGFYWIGSWEPFIQDEYTYDSAGHTLLWVISEWTGSAWLPSQKYDKTYDEEGNLLIDLIGYWNDIAQDWSGNQWTNTERTVFEYDERNRETSQIFSHLISGSWVVEAEMFTTWTALEDGGSQSVRKAYDDDILAGGGTWQVLTHRFNKNGQVTYYGEEYMGDLVQEETNYYDENGNEIEVLSLEYDANRFINSFTVFDENNMATSYESYFGDGPTGPWSLASKFAYVNENGFRIRSYANYYLFSLDDWGWGIDLDFSTPLSKLIQPDAAKQFQDRLYEHKIDKTYDYSYSGGEWVAITFIRYYSPQTVADTFVPNLELVINDDCEATLSWDVPLLVEVIGYNVYRDGEMIAENITGTTYTDSEFDTPDMHEWCVEFLYGIGFKSEQACVSGNCFPKSTITASAGTGGDISPKGEVKVAHNGSITFTISSNYGYAIDQVLVNGVNEPTAVETGTYTFTEVTTDQTIEALFALSEYTIVASAGNGGSITPNGNTGANHGESKTFAIKPDAGYYITQVLVDGVNNNTAVATGTYTFHNIDSDHTIEASFEMYTYTLTATAGTGGTIDPDGEKTVNYGASQTYTITPDTGYSISKVLVDGVNNEAAVETGTYTFANIEANHNIQAEFERSTYTITASAGTGGSITPDGETSVIHGGDVYYSIKPDQGYAVAKILVDNNEVFNGSGTDMTYEFLNVTASHTIAVEFKQSTGIDNVDNTFAVYPVPTNGPVNVKGLNAGEIVYLYDTIGNLVMETKEASFDISRLSPGIYLLKAGNNTVRIVKK